MHRCCPTRLQQELLELSRKSVNYREKVDDIRIKSGLMRLKDETQSATYNVITVLLNPSFLEETKQTEILEGCFFPGDSIPDLEN